MQIAGSRCHVCGERIVVQIEGAHCPDCDITFHRDCAVEEKQCPACRQDFAALLTQRRAEARASMESKDTKGRRQVLACILVLLVPSFILLAISIAAVVTDPDLPFPVLLAITFPISCAVSAALYLGISWARVWVLVSLVLGILVAGASAIQAFGTNYFVFGWGLAWIVVYSGVFYLLAFSPNVSVFFQRRS